LTLSFCSPSTRKGHPPAKAEAHAEAAREFIKAELVTKQDLALALDNLALRMTVRLWTIVVIAIALAGLLKLT
jgi:hypothetical protein